VPIVVDLDVMLARRKMSVADFASAVGITASNVAVLKNGRAKAIRFTTLDAICTVLDCQPGDILRWDQTPPDRTDQESVDEVATGHDVARPELPRESDYSEGSP
jgi:putative transcriptional regulator